MDKILDQCASPFKEDCQIQPKKHRKMGWGRWNMVTYTKFPLWERNHPYNHLWFFQASPMKEFPQPFQATTALYCPYCSHDVLLEFSLLEAGITQAPPASWVSSQEKLSEIFRQNSGPKVWNLLCISCYTPCKNISVGSTIDLGTPKWSRHLLVSPWNSMTFPYTKSDLSLAKLVECFRRDCR